MDMIEKRESEGKSMLKALDDLVYDAKMEGKAESIIGFLEDYGEVPGSLKEEIFNQKDIATMQSWIKLAIRAGSIQNFIEEMHKRELN